MGKVIGINEAKEMVRKKFTPEYFSNLFKKSEGQARAMLKNTNTIEQRLKSLSDKFNKMLNADSVFGSVPVLISMTSDYIHKKYMEVPIGTIAGIVIALTYVLSPVDLISDLIPGVGLLDDAAVITACATMLKSDLDNYKMWKSNNESEETETVQDSI